MLEDTMLDWAAGGLLGGVKERVVGDVAIVVDGNTDEEHGFTGAPRAISAVIVQITRTCRSLDIVSRLYHTAR